MGSKYKKGQIVEIQDINGIWHRAEVVNQSSYRPPEMEYALDLDGYDEDYVFVGEDQIRKYEPPNTGEDTTAGAIRQSMEEGK